MSNIKQQFVMEHLLNFALSPRCCQLFSSSFLYFLPELTIELQKLDLRMVECVTNGIKKLKLFKPLCTHNLESPILTLKNHETDFQSLNENISCGMQLLGNIFSSANMRPVVPPHRFSLGPLKQSMTYIRQININSIGTAKLQPYKTELLHTLENHRVLVVNGDVSYEKSTSLPLYIIEKCIQNRTHCKIICVEREQLLAIYYSERLANCINEKVGNTIAFQVNLQSRISETSNLIYTTANFLLRVLMGQRTIDSFRHISHIIIDDVNTHDAYADILLCELREALRCHPHLRIILLSNSTNNHDNLLEYFGEGKDIQLLLDHGNIVKNNQIIYLNEIYKFIAEKRTNMNLEPLVYTATHGEDEGPVESDKYFDKIIEHYERSGSQESFKSFLYMVRGEYGSINYRHSITGSTATTIACKFGNTEHLQILLNMHADPFVMDESNMNAFSAAIFNGNIECSELLSNHCGKNRLCTNSDPSFCDINLITDLVQILLTKNNCAGNILIFMPNYEQLCRLNFSILRQKYIGNLSRSVFIYMLHADISKDQLESLLLNNKNEVKIIISTDIGESLDCLPNISYVIDSMRSCYTKYNAQSYCNEEKYDWVSKESMDCRANLVNSITEYDVKCFRLIPKSLVDGLPTAHTAQLLVMPLERVCLTIKLLSPTSLISEYLNNVIVTPSFIHILQSIDDLKKLQVLDEMEDVTWLGCRLIDVPVQIRFGKMLVYAILLQCLDPVLTIVSFLSFIDPLRLPENHEFNFHSCIKKMRTALKLERIRLTENIPSDHLMYIRLYQEWQNQFRDETMLNALQDEHSFVLNCILDRVCDIRTHLVGSLRSSQLIHNQGHLSMHHINAKSNSWCLIKAALVGATSNIGYYDRALDRIKSNHCKELIFHPDSVLRGLQPLHLSVIELNSPWIIHSRESNSESFNSISCCTLVTPLTVALFMGNVVNCSNIQNIAINPNTGSFTTNESDNHRVIFHVDDFVSFDMCISDARFLLKIRQCFYSCYINYLQHCGSIDYSRRNNYLFSPIIMSLEKLLMQENLNFALKMPESVGLRPKSVPNNFLLKFNLNSLNINPCMHNDSDIADKFRVVDKQFVIINFSDTTDAFFRKSMFDNLHESLHKYIQPYVISGKDTYLITFSKNSEEFNAVALVSIDENISLKISACFKNRIPLSEVKSVCLRHHIYLPNFDRRNVFKVDKQIGVIILHMFAYRTNLLHN